MTTPGTMDSLVDRIRDKIEDADDDVRRSDTLEKFETYSHGYEVGYAEALRELYAEITGDAFPRKPSK